MFKSKFVKRWFLHAIVLVTLALGWTASARADCPTANLPMTFTYGTLAVSNSLAVGETIPGTVKTFSLSGKCSSSSTFNTPVVACANGSSLVAGMNGVFTTSLAGVGIRMRNSSGSPLNASGKCSTDASLGNTGADGSFNVSGTVELVKTGATTTGTITGASWATGVLNTGITLNGSSNAISIASGTAIRPVSCSVTAATANQIISLDPVKATALPSAGATWGAKPFSIDLNCESGVKVAVTFTSASGSSGIPSVIASSGTATGVGVQLLDASQTPITLDTALQLTSGTTGNASFQFYGQYYRLGAAQVQPGTVSATTIFTMSYQ
ncbi:hypothetical protein R75461_00640 [Paraburkholderia nemoris]|uniref:fimbrial protein n=1 Tax=Paraburkholderia nemoris TaxID=2793076 RepID=UPI00190DADAB|nr:MULTISPECIES: fimbrial protein [Paraburkholderia]MBK3778977.1 fimbrial protein [Paraburkholderia aspalathi]CAE6701477.1 hypothetical protein R75461_00640 [Paraburkholderia nemoris]